MKQKEEVCCSNCKNQLTLMKHPNNKSFGKGSITEVCGWVCLAPAIMDGSNKGVFFDKEYGECEMFINKN